MTVIVTGSVAIDSIMEFPGRFSDHILPDKLNSLNVSFMVEQLTRHHGGSCANLVYNLALLGEQPLAVATVGIDIGDYPQALATLGVDTSGFVEAPGLYTALGTIITDLDDNQIIGFYSGAMSAAARISLIDLKVDVVDLVVIAPNDPAAMAKFVRESQALGWSYLYDPGLQLPRLSQDDLIAGISNAAALIGNEYELALIENRLDRTVEALLELVPLVVVTRGAHGVTLLRSGERVDVSAACATEVIDPTGAGDAFRAGLIIGMVHSLPLVACGRLGAVAAVYAIEHKGMQEHFYTWPEFVGRYQTTYGNDPFLAQLDEPHRRTREFR